MAWGMLARTPRAGSLTQQLMTMTGRGLTVSMVWLSGITAGVGAADAGIDHDCAAG
jgi:hypothetical protein